MIDIYCDAGSLEDIEKYAMDERISGFTTNPSLMKKAGITSYKSFAREVLDRVDGKPVSFEVLADHSDDITQQAIQIQSWGSNVYVKVPITYTDGTPTNITIENLWRYHGIKVNVTAVFSRAQVDALCGHTLSSKTPAIVSIFAGRIMDTGRDPATTFAYGRSRIKYKNVRFLWASAREVYNVTQAEQAGADIITLPPSLIEKLPLHGKPLEEYSLETVQMFHSDGKGIEF